MLPLENTQPVNTVNEQAGGRPMPELRRYRESDIPEILTRLEEYLSSTHYRRIPFSKKRLTQLLKANTRNDLFFGHIAVDEDGKIVGGLTAYLVQYIFADEVFADEMCFFILPEYRSLKLAREFIKSYVEWAKRRNAKEIRMTTTSGLQSEEYAKFLEAMGFAKLGTYHGKEI